MLELKIIKYLDDTMRRLKLYISMYGTLGIIIGYIFQCMVHSE